MKKEAMIEYLNSKGIELKNDIKYQDLSKIYYAELKLEKHKSVEKAIVNNDVTNVTTINNDVTTVNNSITTENIDIILNELDEHETSNTISINQVFNEIENLNPFQKETQIRQNLIRKICILMAELKGKVRGSDDEIRQLFNLYNNFYKRNDSPGCSQCVSNVYSKLRAIYIKYNQYV